MPPSNVTAYAYDTENDLLSITDAPGHTTPFNYDEFRRVTQDTFPAVNSYETYVYDAVGNLTSKTDRKGQTIQYVYDADRFTHKKVSCAAKPFPDLCSSASALRSQDAVAIFAYAAAVSHSIQN